MKTILLLCLLVVFGCNDNEKEGIIYDPPQLSLIYDIQIVIPNAEELSELEDVEIDEIEYGDGFVDAYPLKQFVNVQLPGLYVYEILSDDNDGNWSPRFRGMPDLNWEHIENGYLVPEKDYRCYFPDEDIFGTYDVRNLGYLNLYRFVSVIKDGTTIDFQTGALEKETITYIINEEVFEDVEVIPLSSFISNYVTVNKEHFTYLLKSVDNEEKLYQWSLMSRAYLVDEMVIVVNNQNNAVTDTMQHLSSITLINDARY